MDLTIIDTPLRLEIYGLQATAMGKDYVGTVFNLSGEMWKIVKSQGLKNKGKNIWVYEAGDQVFAGVELVDAPGSDAGLLKKVIILPKYVYYKHVGPYSLIKTVGTEMGNEVKRRGLSMTLPHIEIYGHWQPDETKLETELIMSLA